MILINWPRYVNRLTPQERRLLWRRLSDEERYCIEERAAIQSASPALSFKQALFGQLVNHLEQEQR